MLSVVFMAATVPERAAHLVRVGPQSHAQSAAPGCPGRGRYPVTAVFHGHAHRGQFEGHTAGGVPVYNVSLPLMLARHASDHRLGGDG